MLTLTTNRCSHEHVEGFTVWKVSISIRAKTQHESPFLKFLERGLTHFVIPDFAFALCGVLYFAPFWCIWRAFGQRWRVFLSWQQLLSSQKWAKCAASLLKLWSRSRSDWIKLHCGKNFRENKNSYRSVNKSNQKVFKIINYTKQQNMSVDLLHRKQISPDQI